MTREFQGKIELDVRDSTSGLGCVPRRQGTGGRAERARRALRRHRPGGVVAVRRADQHADDGPAGGRRADLLAVAHDRAVLADPLDVPHRPQPPPQRLRHDLGVVDRLPRLQLAHPAGNATMANVLRDAGLVARSGSARTTTSRSTSGRWAPRRRTGRWARATTASTASSAARPTTGIPIAGRGQPLHRPAVPARGRLPPVQGPRRPGAADDPRLASRPSPTSRGTCGSARAPTTPRTTRPRSTSPSTRASSTTATRPTASGCCRG